jgi:hypothetical protein
MAQEDSAQEDSAKKEMAQNWTSADAYRRDSLLMNSSDGAPQVPARRPVSIITLFFALVVLIIPLAAEARAESHAGLATLNCRGNRSVMLSFSRAALCFSGPIQPNLDLSVFRGLKAGDYVIMRSEGGDPRTAMKLSDILRERNVVVILYDYCLGACADYLLVANRTFVQKDTIVAWRGGQDTLLGMAANPWCRGAGPTREPRKLFDQDGVPAKEPVVDAFCEWDELNRRFFRQRGLNERYIHEPQTGYTKKKVQSALMKETDKNKVYWMWNPKNYGDYFKSNVSFDSYPRSQREVDSIVARHRLGIRVVFDR